MDATRAEQVPAKFVKGDKVESLAEHMEGMKGAVGKVALVRNGPYYGVTFDGSDKVHKWLAESELKVPEKEEDSKDPKKKPKPHKMSSVRSEDEMIIERRTFVVEGLTVDEVEDRGAKKPVIRGHAAVFNQLSNDLGGFREQITPGAFAEAIQLDDVRALVNHESSKVLGRNKSGTLRLSEDATGLLVEIDPPDTTYARDLLESMRRGDITQMSFGFGVKPGGQDWAKDDEGRTIRTLKKLRLFDVSPVTYPAYPQTDVAVRSFQEFQQTVSAEAERRMRMRLALAERATA